MSEWSPELYLKFKSQRTQPAIDLLSRIECKKPKRILDIGSGPGNSSSELRKKWNNAEIIGIDNSTAMIKKAEDSFPKITFIKKDATGNIDTLGMFDIIFSNAAVQWMEGVEELLPYWFSRLNPSGIMAMQIPNPTTMPINIAVKETMNENKWQSKFEGFSVGWDLNEPEHYYGMLSCLTGGIEVWETNYYHVMPGHEAIIDWWSSTGFKPHYAILDNDEKHLFTNAVLNRIKKMYPIQADGSVLFPFRRIFFTITKPEIIPRDK